MYYRQKNAIGKFIRIIYGVTKHDKVRNNEIRRLLEQPVEVKM